ncbi:Uncharacterised protein [Klebsiella aerogenes]|nr:Uncharacterised protein [Klebsiella aerogenes]
MFLGQYRPFFTEGNDYLSLHSFMQSGCTRMSVINRRYIGTAHEGGFCLINNQVVHQTQGVGGDIPCRGVIKDNAAMVGAGNADNILNNGGPEFLTEE